MNHTGALFTCQPGTRRTGLALRVIPPYHGAGGKEDPKLL